MSVYTSHAHAAFATCPAMQPALRFAVLALLPLLAGCSIHPLPDDLSRKSTYDIVQKIRCEAKAAVMDYGQKLNSAIVYAFYFNINEHNDASAGFTLTNPLAKAAGSFDLTANGSVGTIRDGRRSFEVLDSFDDLRKMNCSRDRELNWVYPLTGDVGMYDSVATFIRIQQAAGPDDVDAAGKPKVFTFADTLTYTTTFMGGGKVTVALAPFTDQLRLTAANAALSGSRMDMHKVTVTMAAEKLPVVDPSGRVSFRRSVPFVDAPMAGVGLRRSGGRRFARGAPGGSDGDGGLGVAGGFNNLLSTRMLQQESGAENRALYEQDRQRQLELQRRATDIRVLVGP
jgi:hypothetical protein